LRADPATGAWTHGQRAGCYVGRVQDIGGERIDLAWHGANHSPDNIFIHLPDDDALMLVDVVNPGWARVCQRLPVRTLARRRTEDER
jgi:hypothetical protein